MATDDLIALCDQVADWRAEALKCRRIIAALPDCLTPAALQELERWLADYDIPVHRASRGNLATDVLDPLIFATIPCWTIEGKVALAPTRFVTCPTCKGFRLLAPDEDRCPDCDGQGQVGADFEWQPSTMRFGKILRQCTGKYKVEPLSRKLRVLLGADTWTEPCRWCETTGRRVAPWDPWKREGPCSVCAGSGQRLRVASPPKGKLAEQWIGFSSDEYERATTANFPSYSLPRHPLIELGWTVNRCVAWMAERGWKGVAKSACMGCPFHDEDTWLDIADHHPTEFAQLVDFDRLLRAEGTGMQAQRFLHERFMPLDEAVAEYRAIKIARGEQGLLWPEFRKPRVVRHCNPFGCRSEELAAA